MGKASSSKKVARAAKAAGRPGARKNYGWPLTIGAVVVVGVMLIVFTVATNEDAGDTGPPSFENQDHWHAAFGIYDCDKFLAPLTDVRETDPGGIHTHGEGLMHIHPFTTRTSGKGANLDHFGQQVGLSITDSSFKLPDLERENGDRCGGKVGHVELVTWDSAVDETPKVIRKNIADYAPPDGSVWVLAFVAEGTEVPKPESIANLQDPTAAEEGRQPATESTTATTAATSDSTATTAATSDSSTSTSAPEPSSSSTSAP